MGKQHHRAIRDFDDLRETIGRAQYVFAWAEISGVPEFLPLPRRHALSHADELERRFARHGAEIAPEGLAAFDPQDNALQLHEQRDLMRAIKHGRDAEAENAAQAMPAFSGLVTGGL